MTLAASASASTGTAAFTIKGTSGALSASTALALTINAAAPPAGGGGGGAGSGGAGPATFTARRNASGPWYYENDLVLSTTAAITDLTATVTVPAANVTYNGAYNTFGGQIVQSFTSGGAFVYSFKLAPGQSLNTGASGTFAAQMNGNGVARDLAGGRLVGHLHVRRRELYAIRQVLAP